MKRSETEEQYARQGRRLDMPIDDDQPRRKAKRSRSALDDAMAVLLEIE